MGLAKRALRYRGIAEADYTANRNADGFYHPVVFAPENEYSGSQEDFDRLMKKYGLTPRWEMAISVTDHHPNNISGITVAEWDPRPLAQPGEILIAISDHPECGPYAIFAKVGKK